MSVGAPSTNAFVVVAGTRPEALKLAPVMLDLAGRGCRTLLVATGQHRELLANALGDFGLTPDYNFDIMREGQVPAEIVGQLLPALTLLFEQLCPAAVIVQGDTASALAGAQAAHYARLPLVHIEAGLRSGDDEPFPEEMHRRLIGQLATLHFAPTAAARTALLAEGIAPAAIHVTGNTGIDALQLMRNRLRGDPALAACLAARFAAIDPRRPLILVTAHRRENHGSRLAAILAAVKILANDADIVMPLHPSPSVAAPAVAALADVAGVHLLPALDYPAFVWLMEQATLALTDSGGVQEEAPVLGLPLLVLRDVTERHEGVASGNARLVGSDTMAIVAAARGLLANADALRQMSEPAMPYGVGDASRHIGDVLEAQFGISREAAA
jgi:UDP-N-acetylglucosamine 2-epimerase (non-hydrolysing)